MKLRLVLSFLASVVASSLFAQTASITTSTPSYSSAGGTVTFNVSLAYTGAMSALGVSVGSVPAGWAFGNAGGSNVPSIAPNSGDTSSFDFSYLTVPSSPVSFTFTVTYPAGLTGNQSFSGMSAIFRPSGGSAQTISIPNIALTPAHPVITSATTASAIVNHQFSYTISATESPTSYSATSLPAGLTLDSSTGVISGVVSTSGSYTIGLSATNGNGAGATTNLTLNVGDLPVITSALTTSGQAGVAFSYTISATNGATSYNATSLPSGLAINSSTGVISGTPSAAGTSNVSLSASNDIGIGGAVTLVITIAPAANQGPTITTQPQSQSVAQGGSVKFTVGATGASSYQWQKNGIAIPGETGSSLTLVNLGAGDAATYSVVVSGGSSSVTSGGAVLTVTGLTAAPLVVTQPQSQSVGAGSTVVLSVGAAGNGLSYQWQKDGTPIAGATGSTYTLPAASSSMSGNYSVVISNSSGAVTSSVAAISVHSVSYFGTFANNAGTFALFIRPDHTGVFVGYARSSGMLLVSQDVLIDNSGHFSVAAIVSGGTTTSDFALRAMTAGSVSYTIDGNIAGDNTVSGSVATLGLTLSAPSPAQTGSTAALVGFYTSGAAGSSATSYTIVGAAGTAFVATTANTGSDAGVGTISNDGTISVTTAANTSVSGKIGANAAISLTETPVGSSNPTIYSGADPDGREIERFVNISTRAVAGNGLEAVIAGFVINGSVPKRVLVRAVGPSLSLIGIPSGYVQHPQVQLFNGKSEAIAQNAGWTTSPDAAAITTAAAKVGAFPYIAGSTDAALLIYLSPGNYTAQVTSTDGVSGITLVEVYEVP